MRLISFDVGIKNMGYCIFDMSDNLNVLPQVIDWEILNLCPDSSNSSHTCQQTIKQKKNATISKVCGKKAKYFKTEHGPLIIYCCETHAKCYLQWVLPKKEHTIPYLKKQSVEKIRELRDIHIPSLPDKTKKLDIIQALDQYYKSKSWTKIEYKKTNAGLVDLITIGRSLFQKLEENPIFSTVTHVIIENQISPIANRMKTIQGMLAQHFISKKTKHIEFVSSSNKLKEFEDVSEGKTQYQKNKKDGVFYCSQLLNTLENDSWIGFFSHYPLKKDDLADCFLQGIWWWKKQSSRAITKN